MSTTGETRRGRGRPAGSAVVDDDDLLDRAMRTLARGGYRALSMRGLARELGVSLASVQHRHPTKHHLWRAAVDRLIVAAGPADPEPEEPFSTLLERRIGAAWSYPGLMLSLLSDDAPGHEDRLAYLVERLSPFFESARETLAAAGEAGLIRDIDGGVMIATMLVSVGAVGALPPALCEVLDLGDDPQTRLADGIADLLLFGVVARGSETGPVVSRPG